MKTIEGKSVLSDLIYVAECIVTQSCVKSNVSSNSGCGCPQCTYPRHDLTASQRLKRRNIEYACSLSLLS